MAKRDSTIGESRSERIISPAWRQLAAVPEEPDLQSKASSNNIGFNRLSQFIRVPLWPETRRWAKAAR